MAHPRPAAREAGGLAAAEAAYVRAVAIAPTPNALRSLADVLVELNRTDEARGLLQPLLDMIHPGTLLCARLGLASAARVGHRGDKAAEHERAAMELIRDLLESEGLDMGAIQNPLRIN